MPRIVNKAKTYFDPVDWQQWLRTVKQFYEANKPVKRPSCQILPAFVSVNDDNRPYVKVTIFGKEFTALLDSGANRSIIGSLGTKIISLFELRVEKTISKYVTTADGQRHPVEGSVSLPICVATSCRVIRTLIVPNLNHLLILGSDFCREFEVKIDFHRNQ